MSISTLDTTSDTSDVDLEIIMTFYLFGSIAYLFYGIFSQFFPFMKDPFSLRILGTGTIFSTYLLIKIKNEFSKYLNEINIVMINLINFHFLYLLYLNNLNIPSLLYFAIYLTIISLFTQYAFNSKKYILLYHIIFFVEIILFILFVNLENILTIFILPSIMGFILFSYFISYKTISVKNNLVNRFNILDFIIGNSPLIFFVLENDGTFLISRGQGLDNLGLDQNEVVGESVYELYKNYPGLLEKIDQAYHEPKRGIVEVQKRVFDTYWAPIELPNKNKTGLMGVALDITERITTKEILREKNEQINQMQKLEVVGQLASSIAHDFNNLLSIILMNSEVIDQMVKESPAYEGAEDEIVEINDKIQSSTQQASYLTSRLLTFTQQSIHEPDSIEVNTTLKNQMPILDSIIPDGIDLNLDTLDEERYVYFDERQFEQVILNLILNSKDAIDQFGEIRIKVEPNDEKSLISIIVEDTGFGMNNEELNNIFEPFFTTKEEGTGLGLYSVKNIIENHNGKLEVTSQVGKGTAVELILPLIEEKEEYIVDTGIEGVQNINVDHEIRILVVEDNQKLQNSIKEILKKQGITVITANNGVDAWEKYRNGKFDIILTDILLPKMDGYELYNKCKEFNPKQPIIFMSGYSKPFDHKIEEDEEIQYLKKPFETSELFQIINNILDRN